MTVRASVQLAGLTPDDVTVEAVVGRVGETDDLAESVTLAKNEVRAKPLEFRPVSVPHNETSAHPYRKRFVKKSLRDFLPRSRALWCLVE